MAHTIAMEYKKAVIKSVFDAEAKFWLIMGGTFLPLHQRLLAASKVHHISKFMT